MILVDIINDIQQHLNVDSDCDTDNKKYFILRLKNNSNNPNNSNNNEFITNNILGKQLENSETIEINCKICCFLGAGSYGNVYKIKIKKKYYAFKISENEDPHKYFKRYNSLVSIDKLSKYIINVYLAGNISCGKYSYYSIMEYGGSSLKSVIPIKSPEKTILVLSQLHNISYLCSKYRIMLTDFKLNNIVVDDECRLKLIDLYMDCKSYSPCRDCKIVKTYSTMEIDKMKELLEDENHKHSYHLLPLAIGLMDLLCKKSASSIITNLGVKYDMYLNLKQMLPLVQIACYNYSHKSNNSLKQYSQIYHHKKKLERKFPIIQKPEFYESLINLIEVRDIYKDYISTKKLHIILHHLFSACPDDRSLDPFKKQLNEN